MNLSFMVEVFITVRVEEIKQMIIDRHDGAIQDVIMCLGTYDVKNGLDPQKSL